MLRCLAFLRSNKRFFGRRKDVYQIKLVEMQLSRCKCNISAEISDYMLEKSRLVKQDRGEKNFRMMYYFIAQRQGEFGLKPADYYQ